jgi:hypothetical protein
VGKSVRNDECEGSKSQRKPYEASEHGISLSLSRRGDRLVQTNAPGFQANRLQAVSLHAALRTSAAPGSNHRRVTESTP